MGAGLSGTAFWPASAGARRNADCRGARPHFATGARHAAGKVDRQARTPVRAHSRQPRSQGQAGQGRRGDRGTHRQQGAGTDLAARWAALHQAEAKLAATVGSAMHRSARSAKRWSADARRGTAALATALRAGRNRRRELLAAIDGPALIRALPLWIGTVAEVEDLLPATPGLFDLVVLDEASHVDQVRAAPVLARARRALIVGDPRQLRFVSFVSDVDVASVLARHGADERAGRAPGQRLRPGRRRRPGDLAGRAPPQRPAPDRLLRAPLLRRPDRGGDPAPAQRDPGRDRCAARARRDRGQGRHRGRGGRGRRRRPRPGVRRAQRHRRDHPVPAAGRGDREGPAGGVPGRRDRSAAVCASARCTPSRAARPKWWSPRWA